MAKIDKNSIRQKVFREIDKFESISLSQLSGKFPDEKKGKIKNYLTQYRKINKPKPINLKKELEKIIKDYKTPASSRVHAIKELRQIHKEENIKDGEEEQGDPLLKLLFGLEGDDVKKESFDDPNFHLYKKKQEKLTLTPPESFRE